MSPPATKSIKIQLSKGRKTGKKSKDRNVEVIKCPSGMPDGFGKKSKQPRQEQSRDFSGYSAKGEKHNNSDMDFLEASREIHNLGSTSFTGYQLKLHKESEYKELTGRVKKRHKVPLNILRGMKEKQAKREKKIEDEAKEAGIVLATKKKAKKKSYSERNRKDSHLFGPSPSIGFMKRGIYKYNK